MKKNDKTNICETALDSTIEKEYTERTNLENSIENGAIPAVQTCPEVTINDCRVSMRFQECEREDLEREIARMLLDIFKRRLKEE